MEWLFKIRFMDETLSVDAPMPLDERLRLLEAPGFGLTVNRDLPYGRMVGVDGSGAGPGGAQCTARSTGRADTTGEVVNQP